MKFLASTSGHTLGCTNCFRAGNHASLTSKVIAIRQVNRNRQDHFRRKYLAWVSFTLVLQIALISSFQKTLFLYPNPPHHAIVKRGCKLMGMLRSNRRTLWPILFLKGGLLFNNHNNVCNDH